MPHTLAASLLPILHRAALDPAGWQEFVSALETALGGAKVALHGIDARNRAMFMAAHGGYDPAAQHDYMAHFYKVNPFLALSDRVAPGEVRISRQDIDDADLMRTEFYNDWMRPQEDLVSAVAMRSAQIGSRSLVVSLNLRRQGREERELKARDLLQLLAPHVSHAFHVGETIAELTAHAATGLSGHGPGEAGSEACVIFADAERRVSWLSPSAQELVPEVLGIDLFGRLQFTLPALQDWAEAVATDDRARAVPLQLPFRIGTAGWLARALRWTGTAPRSVSFPSSLIAAGGPQRWLVFVLGPQRSGWKEDLLSRRFGLTPAEAAVAVLLAQGLSTEDIAQARTSSIFTVRNQLKGITQKLSARNRADIARRVLAVTGGPVD